MTMAQSQSDGLLFCVSPGAVWADLRPGEFYLLFPKEKGESVLCLRALSCRLERFICFFRKNAKNGVEITAIISFYTARGRFAHKTLT